MSLTVLLTIIYLLIVLAVGYISTRGKKGGVREFFIAGGNLPWVLLLPFLLAEYISGGTTVGVAEKVHKDGITALIYYLAGPIGLSFLAFGFVKFYHSIKRITVGEAFHFLFDEKTRKASAITLLTLGTVSQGLASLSLATAVAPMFGISYDSAIWVSAAFIVAMALVGLRGQAWMNVVHMGAILFTFIPLAIAVVSKAGGFGAIAAAAPPGHLNPMAAGIPTISAWIISSSLVKIVSTTAITAMFAARSEKDGKIACIATGFLLLVFTFLPGLIGLAGYVLTPGIESRSALWDVSAQLGEWGTVAASIGVIAAIISTNPAAMMSQAASFARDIVLPLKPNLSDKMQILSCRLWVIFVGFAGTYLAILATKSTGAGGTILGWSFQSTQVSTVRVLPLLVSILWRRMNPTVAFLSIVIGVITGFSWVMLGSPFDIDPMWPGYAVGTLVLMFGSLVAKPSPFKGAEGLVPATNPGDSH